jgi:hypothetical protein
MDRKRLRVPAICIGILLTACGIGFADGIKIGAHGGLSIPNIRGSETDLFSRGFKSRRGPFFGLSAAIGLNPRLSLVAELNYTSQGGLRTGLQPITMELPPGLPLPPGTVLYADFRNETVLDYIELPVMARLAFGDKVRFFVNAGPYFGYLVRARALTQGTSAVYMDEAGTQPVIIPPDTEPLFIDLGAETDVKDSLKKTNIGLAGGGGLICPFGPGDILLEARFQLGLTTIQKDVEASGKSQTGAIVISLGYMLPLARHE